jgi:hypothetical protein
MLCRWLGVESYISVLLQYCVVESPCSPIATYFGVRDI